MKPIYVALIAIASALIGGFVGTGLGGVAGGAGGTALGFKYGVCTATDVAKTQKLLTPAQIQQLSDQAYAQANKTLADKGLPSITSQDCQTISDEVSKLAK